MSLAERTTEPGVGTQFRPVQYLGSKWRIRSEVANAVSAVTPIGGRVHDIFAGTGVVAAELANSYPVTATDIQEYSRVLTSALTEPAKIDGEQWLLEARRLREGWTNALGLGRLLSFESDVLAGGDASAKLLADMVASGSIAAAADTSSDHWAKHLLDDRLLRRRLPTIFSHYGGVYFSYDEALFLDALAVTARATPPASRDTYLAIVLGLASEMATSIGGHFAQPARVVDKNGQLKVALLASIRKARSASVEQRFFRLASQYDQLASTPHPVTVAREDFGKALLSVGRDSGCVYADPPYTREHYSRFYHVLETLAMGDDPGISRATAGNRSHPSRGLYRQQRHQSPFSIVSAAPRAFDHLFRSVLEQGCPLVLSYSPIVASEKTRARTIGLDDIVSIGRRYARSVDVVDVAGITHARLNRRELSTQAPENAEVILTAMP